VSTATQRRHRAFSPDDLAKKLAQIDAFVSPKLPTSWQISFGFDKYRSIQQNPNSPKLHKSRRHHREIGEHVARPE